MINIADKSIRIAALSGALFFTGLVTLTFWEYYRVRESFCRLQLLQDQYYGYIDTVKKVLQKQRGHCFSEHEFDQEYLSPDDDELDIDSFMAIDRTPEYLKESTMSYLKDQNLDGLAKRINPHEWHNYTQQVLKGVHQPSSVIKKVQNKRVHYKQPKWQIGSDPKTTLTGIIFYLPIETSKFWLSSPFGARKKPNGQWGFHHGIDMAAQRGTPARASAAGIVEQAGYVQGYGNTVVLRHDNVYKTRYAHLDVIYVTVGQKVALNEKVGAVGDTGFTRKVGKDASHLHFELYERGQKINPLQFLAGNAPGTK